MKTINIAERVWQNPVYFLAFGFGSGLMPIAPGTWGTLAAIPVYLLIAQHSLSLYLFFTFSAFLLGVWVSEKVSRDLGIHDHGGIVWDEIVGYLMTMIMVPVSLGWMIIGFLLFRLFDIWKPQPIRFMDERVSGGFGIMLDDALAAIPACLIMQLLVWGFAK
ncbi:phosphatidylglycerophosphatase A family protein [Legionella fairfieldensis]|uniref:phosphatidylglycerophosphatase A family protein n=1 Tax=Legionella fairfieldensis TaxID=45064 RepID=UPI00048B6AE7|nr:phosphatidylglycerophosphatase A [Legionella fairfieldensis]